LLVAKVMSLVMSAKERTFFLMELPVYRAPRWKNVGITMIEKAKIFVTDAGKVIIVISLLLWLLASYGPAKEMRGVEQKYALLLQQHPEQQKEIERQHGTEK